MTNNKLLYQQLCDEESSIPLFLQFNWFNEIYNNVNWDVALVEKGGNVVGILPFVITKKKGFKIITPQFLSPYQGVWLKYPENQKYANKLSFEKEIISQLIEKLPKVDAFKQHFLPEFTNWLPFFWKGFEQQTRFTYIIQDISNEEVVFASFKENIRREIRKAEKKLTIKHFDDIALMHQMKLNYHENRKDNYDVPIEKLKTIYAYCKKYNCGELLIAEDNEKNIHSMLLYVWDNQSAYYLNGVTNKKFKTSGSMSLLLWKAIKKSSKKTKAFNFEGSMLAPVEKYFSAFGGLQTPYYKISKVNSFLLKLLRYK